MNTRNGVALVIGVGDYAHTGIARLQFAARDAEALADLLAEPDVCAFPPDRVKLLTDREADRDAITQHLSEWLPNEARGADLVVLYFAGHGVVRRVGTEEEGFLLPADADPANPLGRGLAMRDVARWLGGLDAGAVVICLDCCHAGKVLHRGARDESVMHRDLVIPPQMLREVAGKGRFLLASCDAGQYSVEAPELRHGLFTYHLLRGIRGEGDRDGDGRVGVAELFEYVAQAVADDARALGVDQKPWNSSIGAGGVYLSAPQDHREAPAVAPGADEAELLRTLRQLGRRADPADVPTAFRLLTHASAPVRESALRAVQAIGLERTFATIESLARKADAQVMTTILEGLNVFAARPDLVNLLDRLVDILKGECLLRATLLLEKKQLGLGMERLQALFRANHSPYQLRDVLGQGVFTAAYLAEHELTGLEVVVRVLRPEFVGQHEIRKQFLARCVESSRLHHQNLIRTLDVGALADQSIYFILRAHVEGVTLQNVLAGGRKFAPLQIVKILRQLAQALKAVHEVGIGHGGVKPSNIFLCKDDRVVLGDPSLPVQGVIGQALARRLAYDFRYSAPEALRGAGTAEPAADLYGLGCVAYELFSGAPPFVADHYNDLLIQHVMQPIPDLSQRAPALPEAAYLLVRLLLAKQPPDRPHSIDVVLHALEGLHQSLTARPSDPHMRQRIDNVDMQPSSVPLLREASLAAYQPPESLLSLGQSRPPTLSDPLQTVGHGPDPVPPLAAPRPFAIPGYEILQELGRGGMGVVYKARQIQLDRIVALKTIVAHAPSYVQRFRGEALAIARLQHPNIIQIFEVGEHHGQPFVALEFCPGGNLRSKLAGTVLAPDEAARLVESLARAVHAAHNKGILHRDLKPSNVLLAEDGTPKITDFGLAKHVDDDVAQTSSGVILGTPAYMSPEQAQGRIRDLGPGVDIYALGATLYEILTGRPPFPGPTVMETMRLLIDTEPKPPRQLQPSIPRDLETICLKCLAKDPARRYASAAALAEDLHRFLAGKPITARPASAWSRAWKMLGWRK
jgi:serine/threonine protein kinase